MTFCAHCMSPIKPTYKVCPYCGKAVHAEVPAHHLLPGTVLNGKILIGTALGEGGFGITYIGRDLNLDIKVAVKEFYPNGFVNRSNTVSSDVTFNISEDGKDFFVKGKERFMSEARILAKFSSEPGVVEVRDFFEQNNTAYIIMEYLDGEDLKQFLKANGPMSPDKALEILMPVMKTLTKIHAQGLIHRDISPDNIRMCKGGTKLMDFGAAREVSAESNKSLSVMLKPGYAPEEQYRSRGNQGPWTDVYALCATMYMCITGVSPDDAAQRVFNDELKRPSALGIAIGKKVEDALMKGMAVLQKDRYQSVDELIDAFYGRDVPAPAPAPVAEVRRPSAPHPAVNTVGSSSAPTPIKGRKKSGGNRIFAVMIALLLIIAVAGGIYYLWYNGYIDSYFDSDTKRDKSETTTENTDGTATVTEPSSAVTEPVVPTVSQAEDIARRYTEAYFAPDFAVTDGYCAVDVMSILEYESGAAGITLEEHLSAEYGVTDVNGLYQLVDRQDLESMKQTYGDDYSYTVTVKESMEYDAAQLTALCEEIDAYYDENYPGADLLNTAEITAACDVSVEYTLSGSVKEETLDSVIVLVLMDNEWRVLD